MEGIIALRYTTTRLLRMQIHHPLAASLRWAICWHLARPLARPSAHPRQAFRRYNLQEVLTCHAQTDVLIMEAWFQEHHCRRHRRTIRREVSPALSNRSTSSFGGSCQSTLLHLSFNCLLSHGGPKLDSGRDNLFSDKYKTLSCFHLEWLGRGIASWFGVCCNGFSAIVLPCCGGSVRRGSKMATGVNNADLNECLFMQQVWSWPIPSS